MALCYTIRGDGVISVRVVEPVLCPEEGAAYLAIWRWGEIKGK